MINQASASVQYSGTVIIAVPGDGGRGKGTPTQSLKLDIHFASDRLLHCRLLKGSNASGLGPQGCAVRHMVLSATALQRAHPNRARDSPRDRGSEMNRHQAWSRRQAGSKGRGEERTSMVQKGRTDRHVIKTVRKDKHWIGKNRTGKRWFVGNSELKLSG